MRCSRAPLGGGGVEAVDLQIFVALLARNQGRSPPGRALPPPGEGALQRQSPELRWEGLRDKAPTSNVAAPARGRARPCVGRGGGGWGALKRTLRVGDGPPHPSPPPREGGGRRLVVGVGGGSWGEPDLRGGEGSAPYGGRARRPTGLHPHMPHPRAPFDGGGVQAVDLQFLADLFQHAQFDLAQWLPSAVTTSQARA